MSVHFSSKSDAWETPQDFYDRLDAEFNFTLDPCATSSSAKCAKYFTEEDDGLQQSWQGERVYMNPPYGRKIRDWVRKAYEESLRGAIVVALIPARTDTTYWHSHIFGKAAEIRFVRGRLRFSGASTGAPFPSAVIIFDISRPGTEVSTYDSKDLGREGIDN